VGRMGAQSVVIETDKKRMSVRVDGQVMNAGQPLVYELKEGAEHEAEAAAAGTETKRRRARVYSAKEKAQAVLALWSGRRNVAAVMKELQAPWGLINTWEKRALSGMLTALDPTWKQAEEGQPSLPAGWRS